MASRRVAIVGAGMMGTGLAAEYAATGHTVTIFARSDERAARAKERTDGALDTLVAAGVIRDDESLPHGAACGR